MTYEAFVHSLEDEFMGGCGYVCGMVCVGVAWMMRSCVGV